MKRQILISLLVLLSVSGFAAAVNLPWSGLRDLSEDEYAPYKQDELIVRFVDIEVGAQPPEGPVIKGPWSRRAIRSMLSDFIVTGAKVNKEYDKVTPGLAVVKLPEGTRILDAFLQFNKSANVLYAEPNYRYKLFLVPNDPNFPDLWGLHNTGQTGGTEDADVDAPEAWDIHTGDPDIIVAVTDTGIDYKHPDLKDNMWVNNAELNGTPGVDDDGNGYVDDIYGYDFAGASASIPDDDDGDPCDCFFHGTHVAGIIGAVGNNSEGVTGVCWNIKIMALKIFADDYMARVIEPQVFVSDAVEAIGYAVDNGARIINASWGGPDYSQSLYDAIKDAGDAGILFAAAAGNDYGSDNDVNPIYPASFDLDNIISTMSTDHDDKMSAFSNYGPTSVDIAEPGTDILSTSPTYETFAMVVFSVSTDYATLSGTSMSAPFVSGSCALIWSQYPLLPHSIVKGLLLKTVDPVLTSPKRCLSGGRINLQQALTLIPSGKPGKVINTSNPDKLYTTIQAAIEEANNGHELIAEANSLFIEAIDFKGKSITLRSGDINEPGDPNISPENTFILGILNDGSAVTFANNEDPNTILKGFTISWGNADYGGGIRCDGASPTITDCIISNNFAKYYGAGIDCRDSSPIIRNCTITDNRTSGNTAIGGGINYEHSSGVIADCIITNNFADNVGGGIACYYSSPTIFNCIIANNSAVYKGGGIDLDSSSPVVTNCTIVIEDPNASKDGGIFAYHDSFPVITNCILWGNGDDLYNCSAMYSCIEDDDKGAGNIHLEPTFVTGPLGSYYLSQTAAGQLIDSTCVDLGDPATDPDLKIDTYTTRTDGIPDAGLVDMGAHYQAVPAKLIELNVTVVDANIPVDPTLAHGYVDPNSGLYRQYEVVRLRAYPDPGYRIKAWTGTDDDSSIEPNNTITIIDEANVTIEFEEIPLYQLRTEVIGGHGTIQPHHKRGQYYPDGTVLELTAAPDKNYIVDRWTGTDDDASWSNTNTVIIDSDKEITVQFRQPKSLNVPGQYPTISQAMDAAYDHGDKVVVSTGTYFGGYDFMGKAITVASEHPDDPCYVAATIIDCAGFSRAFMFQSGEGRDSVVDGFTIINGSAGLFDPNTPPNTGGTGADGQNALGGAITCLNGSSPTLSNLIIRNCSAWGQRGEDASSVFPPPQSAPPPADPLDPNDQLPDPDPNDPNTYDPNNPPDPNDPNAPIDGMPGLPGLPGQPGMDGMDGAPGYSGGNGGIGYGGAMYFDANSAPLILHCTIIDCNAIGGSGGFGGQGQDGQDGQEGQQGQQGQQGQNGVNDGAGGDGGNGGDGGPGGNGGRGGDGGKGGDGGEALGGAIYFGPNCRPTIRHCTILGCTTRQGMGNYGGAAGNGGNGGNGGAGGEGGEGGDPEGEEGQAGADGPGSNGGDGGIGGDGSPNGLRSWAGAIYYGERCEVDITDTIIGYNATGAEVQTAPYDGGAGGSGGAGGAGGGPGANGTPGLPEWSSTSTYGGGNYYDIGCKTKLTECIINNNTSEQDDGGGEYYAEGCTTMLDKSEFVENSAFHGAGQYFDPCCSIEVTDCDYTGNFAGGDGGGMFCWYKCLLDIDDSRFTGNSALGYGGGLYGGGVWDWFDVRWYNESTIKIEDSRFVRNDAEFGGGLYWHGNDSEVEVSYSTILSNTADHGGGLYFSNGAPKFTGCTINRNTAEEPLIFDPVFGIILGFGDGYYGGGGGIFCWSSDAEFEGCFISRNSAAGSGGGVYLGGDPTVPTLRNCLVSANTAVIDGGGIVANWFVQPTISNCTIVENTAYDPGDSNHGRGGGLSCSYESQTTLIDSILWRNKGVKGYQIAIGSDKEPEYFDRPATLTVSYCDIQGGRSPEAIHVEPGRTLNWLGVNIDADPLFVGQYYLSQIQAGQSADSPCVDAGSDLASNLGMELYTTSTKRQADTDVVDIGLHYPVFGPEHELIVVVVGPGTVEVEPNTIDPAKTSYDPNSNTYTYTYKQHRGDVVRFTASPEEGYRVKSWSGTDKEPSWNTNINTLTMDGDEVVRVEFEQDIRRNLRVPTEYRTIEQAVEAADQYGTNVIVSQGVHYISDPNGIDFQGKYVTLMSTDPDDPDVIANTIIDCQADRFNTRRAFYFHSGEDHNTVVNGFTIRNAFIHGGIGAAGRYGIFTPIPYERIGPNPNDPPRAERGTDAVGDAYGGGILCENGSSPTIKNCVITNCTVTGAWGGDGAAGRWPTPIPDNETWNYLPPEPDATLQQTNDGQWGGAGGSGSGIGHGGAIACLSGSCPIISNCIIRDNVALGGCGGNGGNGGNVTGGLESYGGNGGAAIGDGVGGGIYCDGESCPIVTDCNFVNNLATTGTPGPGGSRGAGNNRDPRATAGSTGFTMSYGGVAGGAAYYDLTCDANLTNCVFSDNKAYELFVYTDPLYNEVYTFYTYTRGGALYSAENNAVILNNCEFTANFGSAVYCSSGCTLNVESCSFKNNAEAVDGSAIYAASMVRTNVKNSSFMGNIALQNGGAIRSEGDADFINCSFGGNRAGDNGGAIDAYRDSSNPDVHLILNLNFERCSFVGNQAYQGFNGWGGGVRFQDCDAKFTDCYFIDNIAKNGGGLLLSGGKVTFKGGAISGNKATGASGIDTAAGFDLYGRFGVSRSIDLSGGVDIGGGMVCASTHAIIENCTLSDNVADGVNGTGGAINFYGGYVTHLVKNCLLTGNSAKANGGAISCSEFAKPEIRNCTFSDNSAGELGGAIFCNWSSDATISDSIFRNCSSGAIAEEDFRDTIVKYCLFHNNSGGDYAFYDTVTDQTSTSTGPALDNTNIEGDPLFAVGPLGKYYLSQISSGQSADSPALDAGSYSALKLGFSNLTTSTVGTRDSGIVDIGYHYRDHRLIPQYSLTATVIDGHGEVEPSSGNYYDGLLVTLTAIPESGWRVASWAGTANDASRAKTNLVVMLSDRYVTVQFDQPRTIVVGSDPNYTTIQHAVDEAVDGDIVIIPTGTYDATEAIPYIEIIDKGITLTGVNPDDPQIVGTTILDGYIFYISTLQSEAIIDGITITNGSMNIYSCSPTVRNCVFASCNWLGADGVDGDTFDPDNDGYNGVSVQGGAMEIINGSPTVQNCTFTDCSVTGGNGGRGANGSPGFDGGWGGWAYGGAVYCGYNSNPTFTDCSFSNCYALGGNGGNGGTGQGPNHGGRGGSWEWPPSVETGPMSINWWWWDGWAWADYGPDGSPYYYDLAAPYDGQYKDYWKYSGYGGAIYCENESSPKFFDCTFTNNRSYGGVSGRGGEGGNYIPTPDRRLNIENLGGTIYACHGSNPEFVNCTISNSLADMSFDPNTVPEPNAVGDVNFPDDVYVSYGGAVAFEDDCSLKFINCDITTSEACKGGAMYWSESKATIIDCNFTDNSAYHGAGLYSVDSTGTISGSTIARNRAFIELPDEPNDPNIPIPYHPGMIFGQGGGYHCMSSIVDIFDTIFTDNSATGSGGGIYYGGSDLNTSFAPRLHNCLLTENTAGRDGGGISSNWCAEPTISNCTIAYNEVTGAIGYGGGLSCSYDSNTTVVDSIIWGNIGVDGSQVAVGTGFIYEPRPARLSISYSDIQPDPNVIQPPTKLDVVFCIDTTGSMWDDIDAVKAASIDIINEITAKSPDYRIAAVDYRDIPDGTHGEPNIDYAYNDDLDFETDVAAIQAGIDSITLGFGLDWRESVYSGVMHCIDANSLGGWRTGPDVARVIILIGDAPPHDPEPTTGYRLAEVIAAAGGVEPKAVFAIPVDGDPITTAYFSLLAEGTGGAIIDAADANEVATAVMEAIALVGKPPAAIYVEDGCTLDWWNAISRTWDPNSHNIGKDPLFTAGHYLSQIASGQFFDSPCVDIGSADANDPNINLGNYTTRTDSVNDVNLVDLGYHYSQGLIGYRLTVTVIEDPNDPGIHGYVDPNAIMVYPGFDDIVVTLTAHPETGYKVKKWTGTNDDASTSRINTVTVTEDKNVTVEFEPAPLYNFVAFVVDRGDGPHGTIDPNSGSFYDGEIITLTATPDPNYQVKAWYGTDDDSSLETTNTVSVRGTDVFVAVEFGLVGQGIINLYDEDGDLHRSSPFPTIQAAIDESEPNYTVVVSDGVYTGAGNYNIDLKAGLEPNDFRPITVRSENGPENCIIDCEGLGRAFIFDSNEDPNYVVDGFTITNGSAAFGGAILIDNSSPTITNCKILNSTATGNGGGIYMNNATPIITNTQISYNTAGGFGGGIYGQAASAAEIINCLITFNTSGDIGGSIYLYDSDATITLCTVAFNYGLDYGDLQLYPNPKGGICCRDSDPTITNCIIGRNGGTWIWGVWGDPYYSGDDLYNCEATYSCIENGDDAGNNGNIDDDPLWVAGGLGDFYLSQVMSGQPETSPCVNAGQQYIISTLQATYNLGSITTSIINASDVGFGDMGYHYPFFTGPPIEYSLQIFVVGNGTVEPNASPEVHYFTPGESVTIKAIPDPGYRIRKWSGTDNDISVGTLNTVNMYYNRVVFVEFESAEPRVLNVSTDGQYTYLGIQDAIDDAKNGDIVVLHSGSYAGTGFTVMGKNITITGTNPDDPNAVASTIIDCTNERGGGIHLVGAPGGHCVLNGITIMNSNYSALDSPGPRDPGDPGIDGFDVVPYAYMYTADGVYTGEGTIMSYSPLTVFGNHVVSNCIIRNCSVEGGDASGGNAGGEEGQDGGAGGSGGSAYGGGIYIGDIFDYWYDFNDDPNDPNYGYYEEILLSWGGSPVIKNCIIDNCAAIAGNGANGGTGGNRASGGTGGLSGRAVGGGIYCGPRTSPTFINCTITNSSAIAANGGNGGDGGNPGAGGYGGLTYADPCQPDPELYSAYGAGIYCGILSKPTFIDCTFGDNVTEGSVSGVGGFDRPSGIQEQPLRNYNIPSYGAGIYCDSGSAATFENCTIEGNVNTYYNDQYTGYGGGVCLDGSKTGTEAYYYDDYVGLYYPSYLFGDESLGTASATFVGCQISDNSSSVGGGFYAYVAELNISDCNFADNLSYIGGGLCASDSLATISGCDIQRNIASPLADPNTSFDPNDPNDPNGLKFGAGGGIYCATTDTVVQDCNITHNIATGSGGGVYLFGESNSQQIINNLITNNLAGRDGGGISVNWSANPLIANCTFVGNAAAGSFGEPNNTGFGGGLFCSYESDCGVTDSIFWNNYALNGREIGVGTGFEFDKRCSTLTVSYSDVKAGRTAVWVDDDCTLNWGKGNIDEHPLFINGPFGDYYLSQTDAGQLQSSPCVDAGSDYVGRVGLIGYTTRTDGKPDKGTVDMGYHYTALEPCRLCDLEVRDGIINFHDFAKLAEKWLEQGCSEADSWCQGADLTLDTRVNFEDIAFLANCWLVEDTDAPIPDPSRWEIEPYLNSGTRITMTAETAIDAWGWDVEYYFKCVRGNCHDSGWQESPTYTDTALSPYVEYGYKVKTRDEIGNETEWSEARYAGGADTAPPAPSPRIDIIAAISPNSVSMIATTAYDDSGVEYYFKNTIGKGHDSGWQDEPNYTDVGLDPNTEYGYRVKARDKSPNRNETGWSVTARVTIPLPADLTPPDPNPMEWDMTVDANGFDGTPREIWIGPSQIFDYGATMTAVVAVDAGGGPVEYYFECTTDSGFDSDWIPNPTYTVRIGHSGLGYRFRVKAHDQFGNETAWSTEERAD